MQIDVTKFYSGIEAQEYLGIKSRQYIRKYVKSGHLPAVTTGGDVGRRYMIRGDWLIDFKKRLEDGLPEIISAAALKTLMKTATEYCEENGIKTLDELTKHVEKI